MKKQGYIVHVTDVPSTAFFPSKIYLPFLIPMFPYSLPVVVGVMCLRTHEIDVNLRIFDVADGTTVAASHYSRQEVMRKAYINGYVYQRLEQYVRR